MERRHATRYEVLFPIRVEIDQSKSGIAISRNGSTTGILAVTAESLVVGAPVSMRFRATIDDPDEHRVTGHVVRVGANEEDPDGPFHQLVAVQFESERPELEALFRDLGARAIE